MIKIVIRENAKTDDRNQMINRKLSAFSLIEMALVLSIIGILSAYAIPALLNARIKARYSETEAKLDVIIQALAGYASVNKHLPFAADPSQTEELAGIAQPNRSTGIIPYKTLGIQEFEAKDGFRHWISYSVSPVLATEPDRHSPPNLPQKNQQINLQNSPDENSLCHVRPNNLRLEVKYKNGQNVLASTYLDFIAFVLVSHGPSGAGAFDKTGKRHPAIGDKLQNYGDKVFIDQYLTKDYDDCVRWVTRNNFMAVYLKQPCKEVGSRLK